MQEQGAAANNLKMLEPLIRQDEIAKFRQQLVSPIKFDFFLQILKVAVIYGAKVIVTYLCDVVLDVIQRTDTKIPPSQTQQLYHLMGYEFAEYFRSDKDLLSLRKRSLAKLFFPKCKKLLIACLSGEVNQFTKSKYIEETARNGYYPFISYAAANDQVALVRYLSETEKHSQTNAIISADPMALAIIKNAHQVFDYLIQTYQPNRHLTLFDPVERANFQWLSSSMGEEITLLQLAIALKRPTCFARLMEKGETFHSLDFYLAIRYGDENIIACCERTGMAFPAESFTIALANSHYHLIRYLHGKGFDINAMNKFGYSYLCVAVMAQQTNVVKELLSLDVDVMACNSKGEHAILIAAQGHYPPLILKMLLDHLKVKLSSEELATFLNKPIKENHTILYYLSNCVRIPSTATAQQNLNYLISNIQLLIDHGLALITPQFDFSYSHDINVCPVTLNFYVINCFVFQQLQEKSHLSHEFIKIIIALDQYFLSLGHLYLGAYPVAILSPDISLLSKWLLDLLGPEKYQEMLIQRVYMVFVQINNANSIAMIVKYFAALVSICGDYPNIFQDCLNRCSPSLSRRINLALLLLREPQDKIRNLFGIYLNHLKDDNSRKLFNLAHILTYYHSKVAQPDQVRALFVKGLAEFANIEPSANDTIESLSEQHPKKILIAIVKIQHEILRMSSGRLNSMDDQINAAVQQDGANFVSTITQIKIHIREITQSCLTSVGLAISLGLLDDVFKNCAKKLHYPQAPLRFVLPANPHEIDPETGKRSRNEQTTPTDSSKRPLHFSK